MTEAPYEPVDPEKFSLDLAARINALMSDPAKRQSMGQAGRRRAIEVFSWSAIARETLSLYESLAPSEQIP
jgi:starch synthase